MSKILVFVATNGTNKSLAENVGEILNEHGQKYEMVFLESENLPMYTTTRQKEGCPGRIAEITEVAKAAKGFIFVGPEYNGSMPPVFNNLMAWLSTSDKDWRMAFNGKFSLLATSSGGPGMKYQMAMGQMLNHIGSVVIPRMISVNGGKPFNSESANAIIKQFLGHL